MDPEISCFHHCDSKIFYINFPDCCPACNIYLTDTDFIIYPFRVPFPFIKASQYYCAVVIKPTIGNFLDDYCNTSDLHIGVTTSNGTVVEFDSRGLIVNNSNNWNQSLLIYEAENSWHEYWDSLLQKLCKEDCWTPKEYDETSYNCYTFVLTFLKKLKCGDLSKHAESKTDFCKNIILPKTVNAAKYISIYRELKNKEYYICK